MTDPNPELDDPLEHLLTYQLRRASLAILTVLTESLAELGVTPTESVIVRFVHANPGCTQAEIGRMLGVKRTNMVPIVSGLIQKALLERMAADGRSHSLHLTKEGNDLHRRIVKLGNQLEQRFFGEMSEGTRQTLMRAFRSLRAKGA